MSLQTTLEPLHAWKQVIHEISLLTGIAKANGSILSLKDLVSLTRTSLSEEQLKSHWAIIPELASSYELKNGLILERSSNYFGSVPSGPESEQEKRARAESYVRYAREVASFCTDQETQLIAISGSTSYHASLASDDLDIFCVTKPDHLWLFLTKSLLLARFLQVFRKSEPRICFSYAMDQNFAMNEFLPVGDPLFARDALTTIVVHGHEFYKELLKRSSWISNYFPHLYQQRTDDTHRNATTERVASGPSRIFLNILLRILVGNYIALKSAMLNRRLKKQGKFSSLFMAKIGLDHCIFESVRYINLRTMYLKLNQTSTLAQQGEASPIRR